MKNYLKLVDFEVKRFWKIYIALIALLVVLQPIAMLRKLSGQVESAKFSGADYIVSMHSATSSTLFLLPIFLCIGTLVIYVLGTWYLEWFGKSTFIYQLLLLPINRFSIYLAKLTSLLLFIIGCLVIQLAIYPLLRLIYKVYVPVQYHDQVHLISWVGNHSFLNELIPLPGLNFIFSYGLGIIMVIIIFTMIVLERSYRLKGIAMSILLAVVLLLLYSTAGFIDTVFHLYQNEYMIVKLISSFLIITVSIWISYLALNKKISV